jgi:oxygen-independent coproporphyrinogen-3 oxidase
MTISLSQSSNETLRLTDLPRVTLPGLYVHVPFCFHKCHYCDFYSITRQTRERMSLFVDLILREAELWTRNPTAGPTLRPRTVFVGGGTPSLLPPDLMQRLLDGLKDRIDFSDVNEWTIEANPSTVDEAYCQMLRASGVDRISFGAQSFDRSELATLERHHDPDDVPRSLDAARRAGFERLNIDLIYALPDQSFDSWSRSLERAIETGLSHLSCYGLTYEPNTPIAVKKRLGLLKPAAESLELQMLHHARRRLSEAGLPPYEISNYARPGEECRHNLLYWTGGSYIGLGPSAASHVEGHRFRNRPHLREWEQAIEADTLPATDVEVLLPRQRAGELVMLQLRLSRGLRFDEFSDRTGSDARVLFANQIEQLGRAGLICLTPENFALTETGLDVADSVAAEFL